MGNTALKISTVGKLRASKWLRRNITYLGATAFNLYFMPRYLAVRFGVFVIAIAARRFGKVEMCNPKGCSKPWSTAFL